MAGPALRTVNVHVAFTFSRAVAGHDSATERSARFETGTELVTVIVTLAALVCRLPAPSFAVLTVDLEDEHAAAQLFPILEPFAAEVAFTGVTSQGPSAAYLDKLASLLGRHDLADAYLHDALETAIAFGWEYHRATTLIALAQSRLRRTGILDGEAERFLNEADDICTTRGLCSWAAQVEVLRHRQ